MADFAKALAIDSTDADTYNNRGLFYLRTGKNDLALADFNKAIKYNSTSAPYYYNRGLCYNAVNNFERAADDFTEGINLNPTNVELYYNMRGQCDINLQKYNEAIADFSKAIDLSQSVAGYWLNRSVAESKAGHDEQAKADALKAQQLQGK